MKRRSQLWLSRKARATRLRVLPSLSSLRVTTAWKRDLRRSVPVAVPAEPCKEEKRARENSNERRLSTGAALPVQPSRVHAGPCSSALPKIWTWSPFSMTKVSRRSPTSELHHPRLSTAPKAQPPVPATKVCAAAALAVPVLAYHRVCASPKNASATRSSISAANPMPAITPTIFAKVRATRSSPPQCPTKPSTWSSSGSAVERPPPLACKKSSASSLPSSAISTTSRYVMIPSGPIPSA
mmetsp:Transcript_22879/g.54271  ORF Transcript_22879/g.54271 Transcript_22879/m.54271 type:complete len:240 (-) Transcript_22879:648-1367(-)